MDNSHGFHWQVGPVNNIDPRVPSLERSVAASTPEESVVGCMEWDMCPEMDINLNGLPEFSPAYPGTFGDLVSEWPDRGRLKIPFPFSSPRSTLLGRPPANVEVLKRTIMEHANIWEDQGGTVRILEERNMRIPLKESSQNVNIPSKIYQVGLKDQKVIDATFNKLHQQNKMSWATRGSTFGVPVFVTWKNVVTYNARLGVDMLCVRDQQKIEERKRHGNKHGLCPPGSYPDPTAGGTILRGQERNSASQRRIRSHNQRTTRPQRRGPHRNRDHIRTAVFRPSFPSSTR
ncbi:hypothetical protein K504DRAFT_520152 [Pleomassaria siparia CBS 279.74]|uniref:Uncharacterized protein n=1 Tax=Pleomassaria siparia CBS 279.74 TaxID=1314801 RepID=A0A6G1JT25_9PLEO|nr:hypothetical protein K504DRAFT_520152 [Pleomassaria siparia CBS 279.74]